jgi:hypothetical protein
MPAPIDLRAALHDTVNVRTWSTGLGSFTSGDEREGFHEP